MRNLPQIERDGIDLTNQECQVITSNQVLESLRRVYMKSKEKNSSGPNGANLNLSQADRVPRETLLENIVDDPYFDDAKLEEIVRVSVDGEPETLDALLLRVSTNHKSNFISWNEFLQFFCKRGTLRESEQLVFLSVAAA
jgi:hypothetical protein